MPIQIRTAVPTDLPAISAIENAAFPGDRLSARSLRRLVASPTSRMLVGVDETGAVRGYVLVLLRAGSGAGRLYSLAVDPKARGFGRPLLAAAEATARDAGCHEMRLEVRADNERAAELYRRAGYWVSGRIEHYYEDGTAALRMRRALARTEKGPT